MSVPSCVTRVCLALTFTALIAGSIGCGKDNPTAPDEPVAQTPSPQPTQPGPVPSPSPVGALQITVNPNPVPHSGAPITDAAGCKDVKYTWFYDQVFHETGGSAITLTNRIDLFDDRETNNIGNLNIVVGANGTNSIRSRWCSSNKAQHTAQTRWTGTDAAGRSISVLGPKVTLSAP
jgi:hypothetical protein